MAASAGGGAPAIGGNPIAALLALAILVVVGIVVWRIMS
jgi:hypothetical protein